MHTSIDRFFLVDAYCPCCGTLLDVDVGTSDEPLRHDRIDRLNGDSRSATDPR
jgi:hypothetical protein